MCAAFGYNPMTEKFPPYHESHTSRKIPSDCSEILDELTKIRQDMERDSTLMPLGHISGSDTESSTQYFSDSSQKFYRFDFDHVDREKREFLNSELQNSPFSAKPLISGKTALGRDFDMSESPIPQHRQEFSFQQETKPPNSFPGQVPDQKKNKNKKIKKNNRLYDDPPLVIPIRKTEKRSSTGNTEFLTGKPGKVNRGGQQDTSTTNNRNQGNGLDLSALPWSVFSQYENETFVRLASHGSNWSLCIGWVAIACGVVIFVRSFFVSSMIWLHYGLPVLSLGAACLFLGILLSILSEKMQHLNDLKQSLTAQRILCSSHKKSHLPHDTQIHKHVEHDETTDIYDRLLQLRSEINELIDECEV